MGDDGDNAVPAETAETVPKFAGEASEVFSCCPVLHEVGDLDVVQERFAFVVALAGVASGRVVD